MGYHKEEFKTKDSFTEDHEWFRTGDLGNLDLSGFLTLSGRLKEIIITAGGKNVAPIPIEDAIKEELSEVVSNVVIVGEKKKYLTCLITLRVTVDPATQQPTDILDPIVIRWAQKQGCPNVHTISDFVNGPHTQRLLYNIQATLDTVNSKSESNVTKVQKFSILPQEFSVDGGELGPTLKLKRFFVYDKYADAISTLYEEVSESTQIEEDSEPVSTVRQRVPRVRLNTIPA